MSTLKSILNVDFIALVELKKVDLNTSSDNIHVVNDKEILQRSIHFGLTLSQGDSVKMANGPDAHSLLALHNPIQFIGVLVNKT